MRIAAIQMTSTPDRRANLALAHDLMAMAIDREAELVAFPENFSIFTDDPKEFLANAETLRGSTVATIREWAAENDIWILGGSLPLKVSGDPKRVTNTSLLISPEGAIQARYDKIHLFDADLPSGRKYRESREVRAGTKPVMAKLPVGQAGLSICYDIRFPELYRRYADKSATTLFIPSAFTDYTGKAHWDLLTRARAVENQAYVVAPAQTGSPYPGHVTHGHTRIVDPWGRVIAERLSGPGVVWADINPDRIKQIRAELPALKSRKIR